MSNTITAYFKGRTGVAEAVYQNDYGIILEFDGIYLPAHFDCYFSVPGSDTATAAVGADNRVAIPNSVLGNSGNMAVHIPLHTGSNDSEVEYVAYFKVIGRARPEDDGTPTQMTAIEQALALLQTPIGNIEAIVNEALSFTGETFAEMKQELQDDFDNYTESLEGDLATWKGGVEADFDNLEAQFDTAVAAVTTDTEVTNIRVGDDNVIYTTAGEAVRKQFANVKAEISDTESNLSELTDGNGDLFFAWEQGNLALGSGAEETATYAIRTGFLTFNHEVLIFPYHNNSNVRTDILKYNSDGTYTGVYTANITSPYKISGANLNYKWRLRVINTNAQSVTKSVGKNITYRYTGIRSLLDVGELAKQELDGNGVFKFDWEQGGIALSSGAEEASTYTIRTGFLRFKSHCVITPYKSGSIRTDLARYNLDGTYANSYVGDITKPYTIGDDDSKYLIRLRIINTSQASVTPSVGNNVTCEYIDYKNILELSESTKNNARQADGLSTGTYKLPWEQGNLALSTGKEENAAYCLRTPFLSFNQQVVIHPYIASGYNNYVLKYSALGAFESYEFFNKDYYIGDTSKLYKLKLLNTNTASNVPISTGDNVTYSARTASPLFGKKIVCFGDSITGNFIPPQDYESTIAYLSGAIVYNAGFGGCCMADNGQARAAYTMCRLADSIHSGDWSLQENSGVTIDYAKVNSAGTAYEATGVDYVADKLAMLEAIDWSEIDIITISYGTNDWTSDYLLDNPNNQYDTTTYLGAFRYSVEKILSAYPNIKIMPITPLWRWWDANTGASVYGDSDTRVNGTSGYKLTEFADGLVEASAMPYHLPVLDMYHNSGFNKFNRYAYFFTNDGTHPKPYGISVIGKKIFSALNTI